MTSMETITTPVYFSVKDLKALIRLHGIRIDVPDKTLEEIIIAADDKVHDSLKQIGENYFVKVLKKLENVNGR